MDAFLADSVATAEGKIYAQGAGWNLIFTDGVPARHDRVGVGILIRVPYTATNQPHTMELRLESADGEVLPIGDKPGGEPGEKIERLGADFNLGRPPYLSPGDDQIVPFAININGLVFERAERYRFVISIDGSDVSELALRVLLQGAARPIG